LIFLGSVARNPATKGDTLWVNEGLCVFDHGALGPACGAVKLTLDLEGELS
jgi:hypothetical protein